jgi:hypothetical protein
MGRGYAARNGEVFHRESHSEMKALRDMRDLLRCHAIEGMYGYDFS